MLPSPKSDSIHRLTWRLLLFAFAAITLPLGCGGGGDDDVPTVQMPADDGEPVKGGIIRASMPNWPENIRAYGAGSNHQYNQIFYNLCYESLCGLNYDTLEFEPSLAKSWTVSDDKMKLTFQLDPAARWSDGQSVTAADVIATHKLIMDDTLLAPMTKQSLSKMKAPVATSPHTIEVQCIEKHWRNFIAFSTLIILPAHEIDSITGAEYRKRYNFKYTATTGPYIVHDEDIKENESLTLSRRKDYWAIDHPHNKGLYNFDKITFLVVRDRRLAFDKTRKGELDFHAIYTAKWWVEDLSDDYPPIRKGHLVRQKVFTKEPLGIQGLAFNMRKPPLDDVRVRKALGHLFDRRTMIDKFAYGEYFPLKSYYPNGDSENEENKMVEFDLKAGMDLLAEADWTERGGDGILRKDGNRLSFVLSYNTKGLEKYYTTYKEAAKKAGVEIKLQLMTPETLWKNVNEDRRFEIASMAWGAIVFPEPKANYKSAMADAKGSNNIVGFKNPKADEIIARYDKEFDRIKRIELLRELDGVLFNEHPYALAWSSPNQRLLYWNKFGRPKTGLPKYIDWEAVFSTWWIHPEKERILNEVLDSGDAVAPIPPLELHPWRDESTQKTAAK